MSALEQLGAFHSLGLYTTNSWRRARPVPAPPSAVSVRPVTRIEGDYRTNKKARRAAGLSAELTTRPSLVWKNGAHLADNPGAMDKYRTKNATSLR